MFFSTPDPAKVGLKKPHIKKGTIQVRYAFRGALRASVSGGSFEGPYAFYGAHDPQVSGGIFNGDMAFYAAERALVEGGTFMGRSAFMGAQNARVLGGDFGGKWAFNESRAALIEGGVFSGTEALIEAREFQISGGRFIGPLAGVSSERAQITGGEFSGEGFLQNSREAVVICPSIGGARAFAGAQDIWALVPGEIAELGPLTSGVVAARRIGRIALSNGLPPEVTILAEEVGEGAEFSRILKPGSLPESVSDPDQALQSLQQLLESSD